MGGGDGETIHGAPGAGLLAQPVEHRGKPPTLAGVFGVQQQLVAAAAHRRPEQLLKRAQIDVVWPAQFAQEAEIGKGYGQGSAVQPPFIGAGRRRR